MHSHPNAHLTPRGRARVLAAVEAGMTVSAACIAFQVSRRCYYRWLPRWQAQGRAGLIERSSRPHRSPQRLSMAQEAAIVALRERTARGADFLAALLDLPASTVHRVIRRQGLLRQRAERAPVVRYEYSAPARWFIATPRSSAASWVGPCALRTRSSRSRSPSAP